MTNQICSLYAQSAIPKCIVRLIRLSLIIPCDVNTRRGSAALARCTAASWYAEQIREEEMELRNSKWKTRLVQGHFPDRSFDIEFWQEQGDEAIFAAAWELVELAEETIHGRKPRHKELLQFLNEFQVDYLIVGGFAVMKYGEPRYTKDLGLWVHNSGPNSARLVEALKKFGAPLQDDGVTAATFTEKRIVYQIGIAPIRIDILTEITAVEFADAWKNKVPGTFFGVPVHFISKRDLESNKTALGRRSNLEDQKRNPKNKSD